MPEGYQVYYLKQGTPVVVEGEITEIPLILKSAIVPPELRDSCVKLIEENGNTVLQESVIKKWFEEQGLELGHD